MTIFCFLVYSGERSVGHINSAPADQNTPSTSEKNTKIKPPTTPEPGAYYCHMSVCQTKREEISGRWSISLDVSLNQYLPFHCHSIYR